MVVILKERVGEEDLMIATWMYLLLSYYGSKEESLIGLVLGILLRVDGVVYLRCRIDDAVVGG